MPYPTSITSELRRVSPRCFCCGKKFGIREYRAFHSGTGLHLILVPGVYPEKYAYKVTDAPAGSVYRVGDLIPVDKFKSFGFRYWADAVCVCYSCHLAIHALAIELCKAQDPAFSGSTPYPWVLAEATFNFHRHEKVPAV
ncbi:hypothetical protein A3K29_04080 [Candidatus Collierbacteria bacterium RIFOXYB2_FULL_46_14]|uniref:Uncharacterized protein n=1 Tax=Candidatus Collierbacteria bacterium GW2011_GWA2_46_26 TaxID=1618381 RepID=A0A0G1PL63_9BACT|nr:MAG: hypothetical protein UW29_C0002G0004 [Candidatus Collierbacteria bacterium GW2011_GWC2_44_13]KKU33481.1 MAG: hypothetical protein UX47_C0003G0004 [Candidatus Collierbacteria bacterium GW2011_GWA2_46_26]OGD73284.1 MAG: hypothetical protein A3K29_04080 [Candidatus Collierbacteria bacterium RIFOXYB2_FULL_46_14]OGD76326.1 MAG: hypothetical protein A3K43_04080 [Candidatus Collierbacteria bacterium RIFOXYA2_FULL_46_20]OGD77662.1 MAG: hypothetical protein A3K39_04080 [Candidatus Collierbacteri